MASRRRRLLLGLGTATALVVALWLGYRVWQRTLVPRDAPVVGLSMDTTWARQLGLTSAAYEQALARVHARTVSLRPSDRPVEAILDEIDALLLTGGGDVDPAIYGGDPAGTHLVDRGRDDFEIALIEGALARDMPILGICRGIQILNVAHGGTLRTLRNDPELDAVHGINLDSLRAHDVTVRTGSQIERIVGAGTQHVNSFHGQAVGTVGAGLVVAASGPDQVVEAIERPDKTFVIATQWHPEILSLEDSEALAIFAAFVDASR